MNQAIFRNKTINYTEREAFWQSLDSWEPKSFDILDKFIKPGKIFIDIGAWNGVLSVYAGLLGAEVYSVEPDAPAFKELINTMINNPSANINPALCAISDATGTDIINSRTFDGFGNSETSLIARDEVAAEKKVFTFTLEDFINNTKIDMCDVCLIKLDVEGGEALIIKQAGKFLKLWPVPLFISFHPAWLPNFKKNVDMFIDVLFPIYDFYPANDIDKQITQEQFRMMLETEHEHSFVLKSTI